MADDIIDQLEKLHVEVDEIIGLLRSKHEGGDFSYPGGQNIPNIILNKSDVESIYKKLHAEGLKIQTIFGKIQKKYGDAILDSSQPLSDSHSGALASVGALKFGQKDISEAGIVMGPIIAFKNSILSTMNGLSLLSSKDPTGKGIKKFSKKQSGRTFSLSRKSKIVIGIILGILGIGGATYEIHVNNISIAGNNGINFGNQQTTIVNNTTINSVSPQRILNDTDKKQLTEILQQHPPKGSLVVDVVSNDVETYHYATEIKDFLISQRWNATGVWSATVSDQPVFGWQFHIHKDGTEVILVGPPQQ